MALSFMVKRANNAFSPVEAAVATFGDGVSAKITGTTGPWVPEGVSNTDYRQMMDTQVATGGGFLGVVVERGKAYNRTKAKKTKVGRSFRGSIETMASATRKFRSLAVEHFGPEILDEIDLIRPLRTRHTETITQVEHAIALYKALDTSRFTAVEGTGTFDDQGRLAWIESRLDVCRERKQAYELAVKANDKAREELSTAYDEFRQVFVNVAGVVESLFRMAGLDEQADRLRYLVRRAGRTSKPPEEENQEPQAGESTEGESSEAPAAVASVELVELT